MTKYRKPPLPEIAAIVADWPRLSGYGPHIADLYGVPIGVARAWIAQTRRAGLLPASGPHPCRHCQGTGWRMLGRPPLIR